MSDIEEATATAKAFVGEELVKTEPTGMVAINFASEEQLTTIPGIKAKLARAIVAVRENSGNITPDVLQTICRKTFSAKLLKKIDFTKNKNLPAVATSEDSEASASETDSDAEPQSEPSGTDWSEVAKVIRAAKQVIEGQQVQKQTESKETTTLSSSEKLEKKSGKKSGKSLILKSPADFMTPKKASPDQLTDTSPVVSKTKLKQKLVFDFSSSESETSSSEGTSPKKSVKFEKASKKKSDKSSAQKRSRAREVIKSLPKNLTYDGTGNWSAFRMKFTRYAKTCEWTEDECLNCLCWCLVGKALDYYAVISKSKEVYSYKRLLKKLEERFGEHELPKTALSRFQQLTQNSGESLEDWADRLLTLGSKAFKGLPDSYATEQVIDRFCLGLSDREAGEHVALKEPDTLQQAIQSVRKYQRVHNTVKPKREMKKKIEAAVEEEHVYAVKAESEGTTSPDVATFMEALKQLEERMQKAMQESRGRGSRRYLGCYNCGQKGHIKRNCPKPKEGGKKEESLND